MAHLSRCHVARTIPLLSRIMGCSTPSIPPNSLMPIAVRSYTSISTFSRNVSRVSLQHAQQQSKKISPSLIQSINQIRALSTGDHVRLWQIERIASAAFIVLLPACILLNNAIVDVIFSVLTVMHAHWGLEAIILDYIRPAVVGTILPKMALATLYLLSIASVAGLMALIYNGPGVGGAIKKLWAVGKS